MNDQEPMLGWWREVFALHSPGTDTFIAPPTQSAFTRLYGGQVAAQSMLAAAATVDDGIVPHSQHTSFLRGGDTTVAVTYRVDRIRDSRAMSTRVVTAEQSGRAPPRKKLLNIRPEPTRKVCEHSISQVVGHDPRVLIG